MKNAAKPPRRSEVHLLSKGGACQIVGGCEKESMAHRGPRDFFGYLKQPLACIWANQTAQAALARSWPRRR